MHVPVYINVSGPLIQFLPVCSQREQAEHTEAGMGGISGVGK